MTRKGCHAKRGDGLVRLRSLRTGKPGGEAMRPKARPMIRSKAEFGEEAA